MENKHTEHVQINLRVNTDDLRSTKADLRDTLLKVSDVQPQSIEIDAGEEYASRPSTR